MQKKLFTWRTIVEGTVVIGRAVILKDKILLLLGKIIKLSMFLMLVKRKNSIQKSQF